MVQKIAVATSEGRVAAHFGRCPQYTIFEVDDKEELEKEVISNPGHQPGFLPRYLAERGIDCIIAGGIGPRAVNLFQELEISTVTGARGPVDDVLQDYLAGNLTTGPSLCDH